MVVTRSVFAFEVSLVGARGRHRGVAHLEQARQLPGVVRVGDAHLPGRAVGLGAEGRHVAAEVEQRRGYVALAQQGAQLVGCEALRHAAHVDLRAVFQRDGASRFVHLHGGVAHARQQRGHLVGGGHPMVAGREAPGARQRVHRGVEGAARAMRRVERRGDERGRRRRDGRRRAACGVDPGYLAGRVLGGQQLVQFEDALPAGVCRVVSDGLADDVHGEGHAGVHSREGAGGRCGRDVRPVGLAARASDGADGQRGAQRAREQRSKRSSGPRTTGRAGGSVLSRETLHHGITGTPVC